MFKLIKRLICLTLILGIAYLVVSLIMGGGPFRKLGTEVKEKSDIAAEKADEIKNTIEGVKKSTRESVDKIKGAGEKAQNAISGDSK